jgi:hypothetical protein
MDLYCGKIYRKLAMESVVQERPAAEVRAVALKAYGRVADNWSLTGREAAALADMSESTWKRAKKPGYAGELTRISQTGGASGL